MFSRHQRKGYREHPRTPDPYEVQSKRNFDGRIKSWRRELHRWDDPTYRPVIGGKSGLSSVIDSGTATSNSTSVSGGGFVASATLTLDDVMIRQAARSVPRLGSSVGDKIIKPSWPNDSLAEGEAVCTFHLDGRGSKDILGVGDSSPKDHEGDEDDKSGLVGDKEGLEDDGSDEDIL